MQLINPSYMILLLSKKQTPIEQEVPTVQVVEELEVLQSQLQSLLAREDAQPFLNPNYSNEQALALQSNLSKVSPSPQKKPISSFDLNQKKQLEIIESDSTLHSRSFRWGKGKGL